MSIEKPFIKWVGGKSQIIDKILEKVPKTINNYHEPFLGGGSVLLAILSNKDIKIKGKIFAYDINQHLINLYKNIQINKDKLFEKITFYKTEFEECEDCRGNKKPKSLEEAKYSRESYYYWLRQKYNYFCNKTEKTEDEELIISALFIILNKTSFRGVYREGPNGYNVPFGHPKTFPQIITKEKIDIISKLIENVNFVVLSYKDSLKRVIKDDFVYLDPPYAPINDKSFVKYTKIGFNEQDHETLFKSIIDLDKKSSYFLLSNANVELVQNYFNKYKIEIINCKRAIHSKNPGAKAEEVLITNLII
jgi:DNA adenine methylase